MTSRTLARRLAAQLDDQRGFTIVETVVAMVVIFASLTALAYTATIGFRYISYGRDRQQATGLANQIMEEIRGQAYSKITRGMSAAEATPGLDSRIVSCSGVYHFETCAGEKIIATTVPAGTTAPWLIPHTATTTIGNLAVRWTTYVTSANTASSPYTVSVIVSWSNGGIPGGAKNLVRIQSKFWSPSGCVSASTHPFAAPCQPFFYGLAQVPEGSIAISGGGGGNISMHGGTVDLTAASLAFPSAKVINQQEQVIQLQADATASQLTMTDSTGLHEAAGTSVTSTADTDPGTPATGVAGTALTGVGGSIQRLQPDAPGSIGLVFNVPAGQLGNANASTAAKTTDTAACPPSGVRENDSLGCVGAQVKQVNTVTATVPLSHVATLGTPTLVRAAAPSAYSTATAERDAVSGQNGLMDVQATRSIGDLYLGGFPTSGLTAPAGMTLTDTASTNYCMSLTNYADTAHVYAGATTTTTPTASVTTGTFSYFNQSGAAYVSLSSTSASLDTLAFTCTKTGTVGGKTVVWTVTVNAGDITHAQVPAYTDVQSPANTHKEAEANVVPIKIGFRYQVVVDGTTEVDLKVSVDPGTLSARGVYGPPPAAG